MLLFQNIFYLWGLFCQCRVGVIIIEIVINCKCITFSKVIVCNFNSDISLITLLNAINNIIKIGVINNYF